MGSIFVVFQAPNFYRLLCRGQAAEPVFAEALVSELAVETFNITILHGPARSDKIQPDAPLMRPELKVPGCELGSVVDGDHSALTPIGHDFIQSLGNFDCRQACTRFDQYALPAEQIDDRQGTKPLPGSKLVRYKVHAPVFVDP